MAIATTLRTSDPRLPWSAAPARELRRLAWPVLVSLISFSTMTAVDTAFVGRLGASALAAVGIGGTAVFCVLSFGVAVFSAAKVRVGEALGSGDTRGAQVQLGAFLRLALVLGVFSVALACLVARGLRYLHEDEIAGALSVEYATLRSLSLPFALISAAVGQWRHGFGDSRTAMRAALAANAANIPLNTLFIFGFGWGTAGAAAASVLARLLEAIWLLSAQRREGLFWRLSNLRDAVDVLRTGLTTGLERVLDLSVFLVLAGLLGRLSSVELAAHQIGLQVAHFCFLPLIAIAESTSVLVAQTRGAASPLLLREIARSGFRLALACSSVAAVLLLAVHSWSLRLFTTDPAVLASGIRVVLIAALLQALCAPFNVLKGLLRGLGDFTTVACVAVGCAWVFSPPLTWLFAWRMGYGAAGAWAALCIEVSVGATLLFWRWRALHARHPRVHVDNTERLAEPSQLHT